VPQYIGDAEVLEVVNYQPGDQVAKPGYHGPGIYAAAVAVCKWGDNEWSSHIVVFADDRPEDDPYRWYLSTGTYSDSRRTVTRHARMRRP
jgi:hypothetical protein